MKVVVHVRSPPRFSCVWVVWAFSGEKQTTEKDKADEERRVAALS